MTYRIDYRLNELMDRVSTLDQVIRSMFLGKNRNHIDHNYIEEMAANTSTNGYNTEDQSVRSRNLPCWWHMNSNDEIKYPFTVRFIGLWKMLNKMELMINRIHDTSDNEIAPKTSADLDNTEDGNVSSRTRLNGKPTAEMFSMISADLHNIKTENGSFPLNKDFEYIDEPFKNDSSSRVSSPFGESTKQEDLNTSRTLLLLKDLNSIRKDLNSFEMDISFDFLLRGNDEMVTLNAPIMFNIVNSNVILTDDEKKGIEELMERIQSKQCTN